MEGEATEEVARMTSGALELDNLLCADSLGVSIGAMAILDGVTVSFGQSGFYGVVGPNGAGKTTLLKCLSGVMIPDRGAVCVQGRVLQRYSRVELARLIAYIPQSQTYLIPMSGYRYVSLGRWSRGREQAERSWEVVGRYMEFTDTLDLAEKSITALSGGEVRRLTLARALAQETPILLLDELTAHMDVRNQIEMLGLLRRLQAERSLLIIAVIHDLNLASRICDQLVVMNGGRVVTTGPPGQVLTESLVSLVYRVSCKRMDIGGHAHFIYS